MCRFDFSRRAEFITIKVSSSSGVFCEHTENSIVRYTLITSDLFPRTHKEYNLTIYLARFTLLICYMAMANALHLYIWAYILCDIIAFDFDSITMLILFF